MKFVMRVRFPECLVLFLERLLAHKRVGGVDRGEVDLQISVGSYPWRQQEGLLFVVGMQGYFVLFVAVPDS